MKRNVISILLVMALIFSFVACQTSENNSDATTTTTKATTTTTTTTTTTKQDGNTDPDTGSNDDTEDLTEYCEMFIPYGKAVVDGVKDASWANASTVSLEETKKGSRVDTLEVKASAMWDNDAIYFLFEITDDEISQSGEPGNYNADGIYIYISEDANANTSSWTDFVDGIYQFSLINKELELLPRKGVASELQNVQTAYTKTETGLLIEFCYTPTAHPLKAGGFMLLDFQYNDGTAGSSRNGAIGWFNPTDTNNESSLWAYVKLLGEGESAPVIG